MSYIKQILVIRAEIVKKSKPGEEGTIPCPVCKTGTINYSIAKINGHVWARCSTKDCVCWIE
jgi:hypothetical protein